MRAGTDKLVAWASALLSETAGAPVRLELVEKLSDDDRRNTLLRLRDVTRQRTLILKRVDGFSTHAAEMVQNRFYCDALAGLFLTRLGDDRHAPVCLGVDVRHGFLLLEDLGRGDSLVEPLLDEPGSGAVDALTAYARRLGRMHAATAGRQAEYDRVVLELGAPQRLMTDQAAGDDAKALHQGLESLTKHLTVLGLPGLGPQEAAEYKQIHRTVRHPGAFSVLLHHDACPDNMVFADGDVRLFDFEFARYGHALIDGLYPQLPFPTCWCCNVVPDDLGDRLLAAYRGELAAGIPEAADDERFMRERVQVTAWWLLCSFPWPFGDLMKDDSTWGIASTRSRLLTRLERFTRLTADTGMLPALGTVAATLLTRHRAEWPDVEPLPHYPALRSSQ